MISELKKLFKVATVDKNFLLENEHEEELNLINVHSKNNFGIELTEVDFSEFERRKELRSLGTAWIVS